MKTNGYIIKNSDMCTEAKIETVNHPKHYNNHPSGIECIEIAKHHDFCIGNAIKYIWRAGLKKDHVSDNSDINKEINDLKKAVWYLNYKINSLKYENNK